VTKWRTEWRKRTDFAEIAEALGVRTDQVMAAKNPNSAEVFVVFTKGDEYPPLVYTTFLRRRAGGVLYVAVEPIEQPGMWEQIVKDVDERLGKKFGDPT
jgi:hypothetical protein